MEIKIAGAILLNLPAIKYFSIKGKWKGRRNKKRSVRHILYGLFYSFSKGLRGLMPG